MHLDVKLNIVFLLADIDGGAPGAQSLKLSLLILMKISEKNINTINLKITNYS